MVLLANGAVTSEMLLLLKLLILALVPSLVCTGIILTSVVGHASSTCSRASICARVTSMSAMVFVLTISLINISVIVVVPSMPVVVKITSLEINGGQALLQSGCVFADS